MENICAKRMVLVVIISFILLVILFAPCQTIALKADAYADEIYYTGTNYSNDNDSILEIENISSSRQETIAEVMINNSFPDYVNTNANLLNSCANVAGANLIGFYDRYHENLIPNFNPGFIRGGKYYYYDFNIIVTTIQNVINELYISMDTNNPTPGTTQSEYKNGLTAYVNSKGNSISFDSVMTDSNLDLNKLHLMLSNGKPVSLYLSGYNISIINTHSNGAVTLNKELYSGNHIMVVYGYKTVNYFDVDNVLIKSKTYLYVGSGINQKGYYILNNNGTINDAEAAIIY